MKRKTIITLVLCIASILLYASLVSAYSLLGYKWSGSSYPITVNYRFGRDTSEGPVRTAWRNGASDWNSCQSKIRFAEATITDNVCSCYYLVSSTEGAYTDLTVSGTNFISFRGFLNLGYEKYSLENAPEGLAVHEFGHVIGLNDQVSITPSIMNAGDVDDENFSYYVPQTDDINGANAIYQ